MGSVVRPLCLKIGTILASRHVLGGSESIADAFRNAVTCSIPCGLKCFISYKGNLLKPLLLFALKWCSIVYFSSSGEI